MSGACPDRKSDQDRVPNRPSTPLQLCRLPDTGGVRTKSHHSRGHMIELLGFISMLINWYTYIIFAAVIMGWLLAFNVVNGRNPMVQQIWYLLNAVTEPVLAPIRRMLPNFGAIDVSPIVLLFGLIFIQSVILPNIAKLFM